MIPSADMASSPRTEAFARAAGAAPSLELIALLDEHCANAIAAFPELVVDDQALAAALGELSRGDRERLAACIPIDLALARQIVNGDARAIAVLERKYQALLEGVCRRFAGVDHTQDDLWQILRTQLFLGGDKPPKLADFDGQGSLANWLRVTAVRSFIDLRRRKDRARAHTNLDQVAEAWDPRDLGLEVIKSEYRELVAAAMLSAARSLEPGDRMLLREHLGRGASIDTLAASLGIHRATAARRLARARASFSSAARRLLQERLGLPDHELAEVLDLVASKLDVSIQQILRTPAPG